MEIRFECGNCGQRYGFKEQVEDLEFDCSCCGARLVISVADYKAALESDTETVVETGTAPEITKPAPEPEPMSEPSGTVQFPVCPRHPGERVFSQCGQCGAPICQVCVKAYGYYCGDACLRASIFQEDRTAKEKFKKRTDSFDRGLRWIKAGALLVFLLALGVSGVWTWNVLYDPTGKLVWRNDLPIEINNFKVIINTPGQIAFGNGDTITLLNAEDGKIIDQYSNPDLAACPHQLKISKEALVCYGKDAVAAVNGKGQTLWKTKVIGIIGSIRASEGNAIFSSFKPFQEEESPPDGKRKKQEPDPGSLNLINLTNGYYRWTKPLSVGESLAGIGIGGNCFATVTVNYSKTGTGNTSLTVGDLASGKDRWRTKLPRQLTWGPKIIGNAVVFRLENTFHALSLAKGAKLWSLESEGRQNRLYDAGDDTESSVEDDDKIVLGDRKKLSILDLNSGKLLWTVDLPADTTGWQISPQLIYLSCTEQRTAGEKIDVKLPPAYEQLRKEDPTFDKLAGQTMNKIKYERAIIAIDAANGSIRWKCSNVFGDLVIGHGRAVLVRDTALTTAMSVLNSTSGNTVIEQLSTATGERLFLRSDPIGFTGPFTICGDRVIGLFFDRSNGRPGANSIRNAAVTYPGLAAFRLK